LARRQGDFAHAVGLSDWLTSRSDPNQPERKRGKQWRQRIPSDGLKRLETGSLHNPAVQDVNDIHNLAFDEIEDQIIAKDATPDAVMFVARNKREGERIRGELHRAAAKLADEVPRSQWTFMRDVIADAAQIAQPPPRSGLSQLSALARHFGIVRLEFLENRVRVVGAPILDIGHATCNGSVKCRQPAFALLHQPEGVADNLAGVGVAPGGKLGLNECLEVPSESVVAGHVLNDMQLSRFYQAWI
jgi:hypothetical protein